MWRERGKQHQASFTDPVVAERFRLMVERIGGDAAQRVLAEHQNPERKPTLSEWTATYLDPDSGMLTGIEPGTRADYERIAARSFLPILGDLPVDKIEKHDIGRWVAWQEKQPTKATGRPVAAKTVRNYHALLSSVLAASVEHRYRDDNPAHRTRLSRGQKREGVFLSRQEFATLLHFINPYYQTFVMFLAGTGCRWGEATALTWGDLDLSANPPTVRIDKAWKRAASGGPVLKHPKSERSRRTVSLWPDLVEVLGTPGPRSQLMFPSRYAGNHLWAGRFREQIWQPAVRYAQDPEQCAAADLQVLTKSPRPHDLRHTHASWLIAAGAPLPFVQARLGHESITTTIGSYGHLLPDAHVRMSEIMSDTMSGVLAPRYELEQ